MKKGGRVEIPQEVVSGGAESERLRFDLLWNNVAVLRSSVQSLQERAGVIRDNPIHA